MTPDHEAELGRLMAFVQQGDTPAYDRLLGELRDSGLTSVCGVALGALAAELTCAHATGEHLFSSHAAPAAIAIAAGVAGSTMLDFSLERNVP